MNDQETFKTLDRVYTKTNLLLDDMTKAFHKYEKGLPVDLGSDWPKIVSRFDYILSELDRITTNQPTYNECQVLVPDFPFHNINYMPSALSSGYNDYLEVENERNELVNTFDFCNTLSNRGRGKGIQAERNDEREEGNDDANNNEEKVNILKEELLNYSKKVNAIAREFANNANTVETDMNQNISIIDSQRERLAAKKPEEKMVLEGWLETHIKK